MGPEFSQRALPAIKRLFLDRLPKCSSILDLCCGTGQMARILAERGYRVTGLDSSEEMLRFARRNAPTCKFLLEDARQLRLPGNFAGVVSTFNSLAHIGNIEELAAVFCNVNLALSSPGLFVFDLSMEPAYRSRWLGSFSMVADDHVCLVRPSYSAEQGIGHNDVTCFQLLDHGDRKRRWQRSDFSILQKCYPEADLRLALQSAGFSEVRVFDAEADLAMTGEHGRSFFQCSKG